MKDAKSLARSLSNEALAPVMKNACNRLAGQNVATPGAWFKLRDDYRGRMEPLFPPQPR